jgi:hypothetical protein
MTEYDNNNFEMMVDQSVLDFLRRDFRKLPSFKAKPLQLSDFTQYYNKNKIEVECEEFARSVLDWKNGTSIRAMIRILSKYSGASVDIQRRVIGNLVSNDRYVKPQIIFRQKADKNGEFELDVDSTLLFLTEGIICDNKSVDSSCYS